MTDGGGRPNAWNRTSHQFDPVLDFDRAVRDPANPRQINPAYDVGDHLHMNPAGYGGIASNVPASLFRTLEAHVCRSSGWPFRSE
jgi:lysophospholipase L1-like esterase